MSYYDDYDDECSSEEDIYYHNYSVDYANQLLGGHHAVSSCLPLMRRRQHQRHTPRLVRVATFDQMPIAHRQPILPGLHSQPKYHQAQEITPSLPPRLPTLEATNDELERRASRRPPAIVEENEDHVAPPVNYNDTSQPTHRPMTEDELRQVQQQQQAFQQHLLNMQRHLEEQSKQAEERTQEQQMPSQVTTQTCSLAGCSKRRNKVSFHDLERDDDQAQIAELIETDPYFAAAMEDFAQSHGLLPNHRHRTHSANSSSRHSQQSHHDQRLPKRHRPQFPQRPPSRLSHSSSSSSVPSVRKIARPQAASNIDVILLQELQGIRHVMEEYVQEKKNRPSSSQPTISVLPVPWLLPGGQLPTSAGVHYPTVPPVTDYQPSVVPRERPESVAEPTRVEYQNVVNAMKEVIDRRSPSQRELPLKPSDIDPKLRHVYTRPPKIRSSNLQPTLRRPPSAMPPPTQHTRRRSSQISTPSTVQPLRSTSSTIPPAPPYELLANSSSTRPTTNQNRTLSYGNSQKQGHIYDTLQPGHYLRLYTNKYHH